MSFTIAPAVRRQTIADALRRTALRLPAKTGIVCGATTWTYAEFDALVTRLAAGLVSIGVAEGDKVAVLARNSHGFAALRFALARRGAVMVPINFMLKADEVAYILRHAGAKTLATDSGLAELAQAAGMRYAVMTSKHHDGFTLFNSKEPYSLANDVAGGTNISPKGRDVAREFADAMRNRGLKPGFYYSLLDWQHPDAYEMALPAYPRVDHPRDHERYRSYVRGHVAELLSGYGPLATIWFDYSDESRQGAA